MPYSAVDGAVTKAVEMAVVYDADFQHNAAAKVHDW
jgi:hypothetical protein